MGDFRTATGSPNIGATSAVAKTDYDYDVNGNLLKDLNKEIGGLQTSGIQYNHLNLPYQVAVTNKGTITYIYDACGRKLEKQTLDNTAQGKTTKTAYIGGYVFQDDVLQFIGNEEGRARPKDNGFVFDYFIKDHLGNTRMVLTDEQQTDAYPVASMETANADSEKLYYTNIDETRSDKPAGYPEDTYTNPNEKVAKLNGSNSNSKKIGPAILLKVMSGDQMNIRANAYYRLNGASAGTPSNPFNELLAALAASIQGVTGGKFGLQQGQSSSVLGPGITDLLQRQTDQYSGNNRPKAFLNWILLDEQFKIVNFSTGFEPVGADGELKTFVKTGLPISQNGYLYVYTSNESPVDVFFDNLQVTHVRGPLLEETHYYPFGLTMAGTSSRAANTLENKRKWNKGSELESKEFSDGSGLELYSTFYRSLDPQLGRFWQIDPKPNYIESPYASMGNNPISYNDPLGDTLLTKADKRRADRIEKQINKTNSSLNKNVNNWKAQIAAAKAKGNASIANSLQGNVNDANARITANNTTLDNLNAIREDPTQAYTFNQLTTDSKIGGTMLKTMSVNGSNQNVIVMSVLSDDNAVHELTHAFQGGIKRMFSFNLNNELYPVSFRGATFFAQGINANAEVAAYQAQYGFNPGSMPSSTWGGTPSSINYINAFYVGGINQPGTTSPVYENVRDMVNTFMQFLRSY